MKLAVMAYVILLLPALPTQCKAMSDRISAMSNLPMVHRSIK